jgi:hypothetical protein
MLFKEAITMNLSERKLTVLDQICSADGVRRRIIETASALMQKGGRDPIEEIAETAGEPPVTYHYEAEIRIMRMIMEDSQAVSRALQARLIRSWT